MSVTINGVLYTRIGSTATARVGDGTRGSALTNINFAGEVKILPYVDIDSISCCVTEVWFYSFCGARNVINVILPNTITTLKDNAFAYMDSFKSIIIPKSVTSVENFFIANMAPDNITFCGTKEPKTVGSGFISSLFKGKVIVPLDYEPTITTFLSKEIIRRDVACSLSAHQWKMMTCFCRRIQGLTMNRFAMIMLLSEK